MSGTGVWSAQNNVELIAAETIQAIANVAFYATLGASTSCAATYSISDMIVTVAAGSVLHNGTVTAVAGNTVTLVSDPTNPRWTYRYINSSGVAAIVSGSPSATPAVPDPGANPTNGLDYVQAGLTIAGNATYKLDKRVFAPGNTLTTTGLTQNYKSATQVISASTAFVDVTGALGATFSFAIGANEVWEAEYWVPLTFGGTGGAKFQLTGPSSPTNVDITGERTFIVQDSASAYSVAQITFSAATAFSSAFASANSRGSLDGTDQYYNSGNTVVSIKARIINGVNAGTVTLQAAQNSANSTTTLGLSTFMRATRVA